MNNRTVSIVLDEAADDGLGFVSDVLDLSRSEVVRRLILLATAAAHASSPGPGATQEERAKVARIGFDEWGIFTLGDHLTSPEHLARVRLERFGPVGLVSKESE